MSYVLKLLIPTIAFISVCIPATQCIKHNFVVVIRQKTKYRGAGALILPGWVITSGIAIGTNNRNLSVKGWLNGGQEHVTNITKIYRRQRLRLLELERKFLLGGVPTLPMATRFDGYVREKIICREYAYDEKIIRYSVKLEKNEDCELEDRAELCVSRMPICHSPKGAFIVCAGLLMGVRVDSDTCGNRNVFSSIATVDNRILGDMGNKDDGYLIEATIPAGKSILLNRANLLEYSVLIYILLLLFFVVG